MTNNKYITNIIEYCKKGKIVHTKIAKRIIRKCNKIHNLQFSTTRACNYTNLLNRTICRIEKENSNLTSPNNAILQNWQEILLLRK